jgi:hypothetical protein
MLDRQMLDAIQYSIDVPCFSGQCLSYYKGKCRPDQQKQRIIKQRSQLQHKQYCQVFYPSNLNTKQRHKKRHNKISIWNVKMEQFQKMFQHLLILEFIIRIFFFILITSPIQVSGVLEKQQKQQDESILAVFDDSYEGYEVELQRMVSFSLFKN